MIHSFAHKYCYVSPTIQLNLSFVYTQLNSQRVLFLTVLFNKSFVCTQFKCQTVLFRTLSGATTLGQSGPWSSGNEGVLHIPQSSWTGVSPSDCLVSYPRHTFFFFVGGESYPSAEMQSVYSTASTKWTTIVKLTRGKIYYGFDKLL